MAFAHDTQAALEAAAYLANTALEPDTLTSLGDLGEFFDTFKYTGVRPTDADLEPTRTIRRTLHDLFAATRDGAVPQVNHILAGARALPQLVRHGDVDWHIHATTDDRPLAERILVETAMAMIDMIRADEMSRFDRCANDDCDGIVLDLSRNRSRMYCSTACTNRAAAAAYRARQSADD